MTDAPFPRPRFLEAGASDAEADQLEAEFNRSDISARGSLVDFYQSSSQGMLREHLEDLREAGHFEGGEEAGGTTPPAKEPAPDDDDEDDGSED